MLSPFMRLDRNFRLGLRRTTTKFLFITTALSIPLGPLNAFGEYVRVNTATAMDLALDRTPSHQTTLLKSQLNSQAESTTIPSAFLAPTVPSLKTDFLSKVVEKSLTDVMIEIVYSPLHETALTPLEFIQASQNFVCTAEPTLIEISALPETLYLSEPEQIESLQHQPNERQFGVEFPPLSPGQSHELYRITNN